MSEELKPCPCCGGKAYTENLIMEAVVRCDYCLLTITRKHDAINNAGLAKAIAAWNRRPAPARELSDERVKELWDSHLIQGRITNHILYNPIIFARAILAASAPVERKPLTPFDIKRLVREISEMEVAAESDLFTTSVPFNLSAFARAIESRGNT